jgi:hypothetical protein
MQVHGPSQEVDEIRVRLNPGSGHPFAVVEIGGVTLYLQTIADADELIKAAVEAKRLLLGETGEDLDTPPATDARDADGTPPGHQLPAAVTGWDDPLPPYHATGTDDPYCMAKDSDGDYTCTAQAGHAGPLHVAFDAQVPGESFHSWPVADMPAGTDAR